MGKKKNKPAASYFISLAKSIWLFPIICTAVLLLLTAFKISGSSIGFYNDIFYGSGHKDTNLLLNKPRPIRSDEWVWNSQMIMAQASNHYNRINNNLGHGQDMSLIIDVPYKDWSAVFRPQNLAFFVLPFEYAFAFKWWLMAYLLVLSAYFFVLYLLPHKRLLAALLAIALLFSPFVQWWYQYITVAPFYYAIFILLAFMAMVNFSKRRHKILMSVLMAYLLASFILILYPPFQIACAIVGAVFAVGYCANQFELRWREWLPTIGYTAASIAAAGLIALVFVMTRHPAVKSIENTAYPGKRVVASGGYNFDHLLSGHLDFQLQFSSKADKYQLPAQGITNQSEDSNFIFLIAFLIIPAGYMIKKREPKNIKSWALGLMSLAFIILMAWLFIPHLTLLSKLSLLYKVPQNRLIIGLGLLNFLFVVEFIRQLSGRAKKLWPQWLVIAYAALIYVIDLALAIHAKDAFPGYIGIYRGLLFSLPVPVIIYLILTKRFTLAALGWAAFSLFMVAGIHPLYRGTGIITATPLSQSIRQISSQNRGYWVVENAYLENFAFLNGAHSLSGVYSYPQLDIWSQIKSADPNIYNRYAHTNFTFYRDNGASPTKVELSGGDHFGVDTEPCSQFIMNNKVHFLLTSSPLSNDNKCLSLIDKVSYPAMTAYIYRVN